MMTVPGKIVDRMRANLAAAGVPLADADLDALLAGPFLEGVVAFDALEVEGAELALPDYLGEALGDAPVEARTSGGGEPAPAPDAGSIEAVAARLRVGEISPVELTRRALQRIEERDGWISAFQLVLAERALQAARRAEEEIVRGGHRGPLHGVPVAVKDLMAMRGTPTTAGSRLLASEAMPFDAAAVERLERAGAIIVGKTRMSEFAYLPGSANGHYGPTRNPRAPEHDAGGSSSGSAAAVADGMVFAALGTDTGGSIRIPASFCGIVGLKPTFGRVSQHGVVPLAWSLDHLGPLTRTVGDAALLLDLLSGADPRDARTREGGSPVAGELAGEPSVQRVRIGVPGHQAASTAPEAAWGAVRRALAGLKAAGAELVEVDLPDLTALWLANNAILAVEAAAYHLHWLRPRLAEYGDLLRHRLLAAHAHAPTALVRAERIRRAARERMERLFERIDLLALPTQPGGAPRLGAWGPTLLTGPFNALGWPALSLPVGVTPDGLPLGLQLVARPWREGLVLRAGRMVELQGTGGATS